MPSQRRNYRERRKRSTLSFTRSTEYVQAMHTHHDDDIENQLSVTPLAGQRSAHPALVSKSRVMGPTFHNYSRVTLPLYFLPRRRL